MVVGSAVTLAVLNVQRAILSSGLVVAVNVGVYSDSACTLNLTSIDWGSVYPGGSAPQLIYVKNTGNAPITTTVIRNGRSRKDGNSGTEGDGVGLAVTVIEFEVAMASKES
jgi:hypothetical protein